jgi:hypothetical protein
MAERTLDDAIGDFIQASEDLRRRERAAQRARGEVATVQAGDAMQLSLAFADAVEVLRSVFERVQTALAARGWQAAIEVGSARAGRLTVVDADTGEAWEGPHLASLILDAKRANPPAIRAIRADQPSPVILLAVAIDGGGKLHRISALPVWDARKEPARVEPEVLRALDAITAAIRR